MGLDQPCMHAYNCISTLSVKSNKKIACDSDSCELIQIEVK